MNKLIRKKCKGFTLLETVIALTLILAAGLTGLHITLAASNLERKNEIRFFAVCLAEDTFSCFQFSEDDQTLEAALKKLDDGFFRQPDTDTYCLNRGSYLVTVDVDFENNRFAYRAEKPNGDVIYEFAY